MNQIKYHTVPPPLEQSLDLSVGEYLQVLQSRIMNQTHYFGVKALKNPLDFWIYQEIIYAMKPDIIVEIGNNWVGSTLALAHMLDLLDHGKLIAVDIDDSRIPEVVKNHPRIKLMEGAAIDVFTDVRSAIGNDERVLVIGDSSHTYDNTLSVLRSYSTLTKPGDYFIVEDSICHHGLDVGPNPGPYEAIEAFIAENGDLEIDRTIESFLITWKPKGFLRRRLSKS